MSESETCQSLTDGADHLTGRTVGALECRTVAPPSGHSRIRPGPWIFFSCFVLQLYRLVSSLPTLAFIFSFLFSQCCGLNPVPHTYLWATCPGPCFSYFGMVHRGRQPGLAGEPKPYLEPWNGQLEKGIVRGQSGLDRMNCCWCTQDTGTDVLWSVTSCVGLSNPPAVPESQFCHLGRQGLSSSELWWLCPYHVSLG
jgi:hypothetical protein